MARNPMQRKARNSFLIGMLTTLLICGVIMAFMVMLLSNLMKEKKNRESLIRETYILKTAVESGKKIDATMIEKVSVDSTAIPSDAITIADISETTVAKIDLQKGTVLAKNMISEDSEATTADMRTVEYNMLSLPTDLTDGDYVDIRLRLPSGQDYIVSSKKSVIIPWIGETQSTSTIAIKMTEDEIITMSCAIVENYTIEGSLLYVVRYVEPGLQQDAIPTYSPSGAVQQLIYNNPNIVTEAKNAIITRYNGDTMRGYIDSTVSNYSGSAEETSERISSKTTTEATTTQEERKTYLQSLTNQ